MKKDFTTFLVLAILIGGVLYFGGDKIKKESKVIDSNNDIDKVNTEGPVLFCYSYSKKISDGLYDKASLKLNINNDIVSGEFNNYPAEKDSKIGSFEGLIGPLDKEITERTAVVWWNSLAEGMQVKEELIIELNGKNANVAFGEMIDRGDGVYIYKDKKKLSYDFVLSKISCDNLNK